MTMNTRIGEFLKESRIPGSTGSTAKKITVKLYGRGVFAKQENRPGSDNTSYYKRKGGQFIYSKLDFLNGAFGIIPEELDGYESTVDLPCFDFTTPEIFPEWFLQFVSRNEFYTYQGGLGNGGRKARRISPDDFLDLEIDLPPLPEQKKIAEILSGIDTEINCLKEQTERCLRILLTISEDVFRNCKSKFPSQDLAQVCSVITKGATPTTFGYELSGIRFPGSVTFLGGGSTSDLGEFDQNPARYCAPEAVGTLKRSELRAGDTLVTIVGASIGNTCQIPDYALPANINQNVALVRSNESVLDCDYLSLYLKTEGRKVLVNIATTQAQPSVSLKQVGELQIPMPPTNEQRRISEAVTSIRNWKIQLERKMHTMAHLKQALSTDLLSGRKRVSI